MPIERTQQPRTQVDAYQATTRVTSACLVAQSEQYTTEQAYKAMLSARDDREFLSDHEIAGIKLRIAQERALGNYESALLLHDAYGFHLQYEIKVLERYEEQDYVRDLKIICEK